MSTLHFVSIDWMKTSDFLSAFIAYNKTDDGWIIFKDHQYYIYSDISGPMVEGRRFCKQRHADLVVINDEEERVFLWHQVWLLRQDFNDSKHKTWSAYARRHNLTYAINHLN